MITLFYAGALTFLGLILAGRIVSIRLSDQVLLGTADNTKLLQATRAQANLVEYAPFFLILLGCMENGRCICSISVCFRRLISSSKNISCYRTF